MPFFYFCDLNVLDVKNLSALVEPVIQVLGYQLWGCEIQGGNRVIIRLYIDRESGIGIEDCVAVSQQVSPMLAVCEELADHNYALEVSSPGWDRLLFTQEHYERFIGQNVKIKMFHALEGRSRFHGIIKSVHDGLVELEMDGQIVTLPLIEIKQARLSP